MIFCVGKGDRCKCFDPRAEEVKEEGGLVMTGISRTIVFLGNELTDCDGCNSQKKSDLG